MRLYSSEYAEVTNFNNDYRFDLGSCGGGGRCRGVKVTEEGSGWGAWLVTVWAAVM